ncbi:DoxX family protein [Puerhibacterium sp. TATVAM-FAB25]|uniref:DoxX family protein n=1 Tax=Puerhibacterium sp. TATVAM-FAB25 TaxID=3093699 RepID=UPI0039786F26
MLLRRFARPLLATSFVYDGVQAALHPAEHTAAAREGAALATERLGVKPLSDAQLTLCVRVHGAATALAGLLLGLGKAPRTAALALAALTVPLAVVNQPFTSKGAERQARTTRFVRNLGAVGAALIAGVDTEGRPGVAWRVSHARQAAAKATARSARRAEKKLGDIAS